MRSMQPGDRTARFPTTADFALNDTFGVRQQEAGVALERVATELNRYHREGYACAAQPLIDLIEAAKARGVTNLTAAVGHHDSKDCGAEFGSTSSDWRLTGAIRKTALALSVHFQRHDSGNSYVLLHACFPDEVQAFGRRGKDFRADLTVFKNEGIAELALRSPEDDRRGKQQIEEMERVYRFGKGECAQVDWSAARYHARPNGIIHVLTPR